MTISLVDAARMTAWLIRVPAQAADHAIPATDRQVRRTRLEQRG
ncbi:MAG: hypothetical protein ACRDQW_15550 [Haloechinothrix sp.]